MLHQGGRGIMVTLTTGPPLGLSEQLVPAQLQGVPLMGGPRLRTLAETFTHSQDP